MKFSFTYHGEDRQDLILDAYKVRVTIAFKNGELFFVDIGGDTYEPYDDRLFGIAVMLGDFPKMEWVTLQTIKQNAAEEFADILAEAEEEMADEALHAEIHSSPQYSGRIA